MRRERPQPEPLKEYRIKDTDEAIRIYSDDGSFQGAYPPSFELLANQHPGAMITAFCADGARFSWFWIVRLPADAAS